MKLGKQTTMKFALGLVLGATVPMAMSSSAWAVLPQAGDLVMAHSDFDEPEALELVRGPLANLGGVSLGNPWETSVAVDSPIQAVRFDNLGGITHNVNGNLLGVDFGNSTNGGIVYSLATTGADPPPAAVKLFSMNPSDQVGPILPNGNPTRLGGLSVSPDNTKIAVTGYDSTRVIVFDYTADNGMGTGTPALTAVRETAPLITITDTQGTAWLDNNTVLAFATGADLYTVNATTMATNKVQDFPLAVRGGEFTSIVYNPSVSPYIYAGISSFAATVTENTLFIMDPANSFGLVKQLNLSTTLGNTLRDMALDPDGNLFISMFGGDVAYIEDVVTDPASLLDTSPVRWFESAVPSGFNGIDIGFGPPSDGIDGDFDDNGVVDARDYTIWRDNLGGDPAALNGNGSGAVTVVAADYDLWVANFGEGAGSGGLAASGVPEPTSALLMLFGVCGLAFRRRAIC
jgi:hypothetical protein